MNRTALLIALILTAGTAFQPARPQEADTLRAEVPRMQSATRMLEAFDSIYTAIDSLPDTGIPEVAGETTSEVQAALPSDSLMMIHNPFYDEEQRASEITVNEDSLRALYELRQVTLDGGIDPKYDPYFVNYNPQPWKAVWYAALFPGGGQIYNRKYWKLPIIYGGFLALLYGYNWNQRYYRTYVNAYRDLVQESPNASYLDFLPPNYPVAQRKDYLEKVFKNKKNTYRNWRDYCVLGMIGVYLVSMVDAYVDASLYHFDISTDLGPDEKPEVMVGYTIDF